MRIMMISGYGYWGNIGPDDLKGDTVQIGGGETAMFSIARELAARDNEVLVFYDTARPGKYDGVDYVPTRLFAECACAIESDVMVSWDNPHVFRFADLAKVHVMAFQLNDAFIGPFDHAIDKYFHPSQWHSEMFHKIYPEMSTTKSVVRITNGINYERYAQKVDERIPHRIVYSSSPDRGLHHLLRIWPRILERVPDAELKVFYDISKWLSLVESADAAGKELITTDRAHVIKDLIDAGLQHVEFVGAVGQWRLAREQLRSSLMVYSCDPVRPTEGFSMSILEGIIAGCKVITTNADALPELWSGAPGVTMLPLPIDDAQWVDAITAKLTEAPTTPSTDNVYVNQAMSWKTVAQRWIQEFNVCLSTYSQPS